MGDNHLGRAQSGIGYERIIYISLLSSCHVIPGDLPYESFVMKRSKIDFYQLSVFVLNLCRITLLYLLFYKLQFPFVLFFIDDPVVFPCMDLFRWYCDMACGGVDGNWYSRWMIFFSFSFWILGWMKDSDHAGRGRPVRMYSRPHWATYLVGEETCYFRLVQLLLYAHTTEKPSETHEN